MTPGVVAMCLVLASAACSTGEAGGDSLANTSQPSALVAESDAGTKVELSFLGGDALRVGLNRVALQVSGHSQPPVVDLLSPEMPMHGVVRHTPEAASAEEFVVDIEVPMEGAWSLFVDFGDNDVVEYSFAVAAAEEPGPPEDEPTHHQDRAGSSEPSALFSRRDKK